ncbi:EAL domain-containing protein [Aquibium sp. A9E412]|uniref:EAL domain-containing response regulator n=1 Tax=Aquibium sp. A9E412 TaxID=2976767 RepID=UPI0025AF286F|nr:EAL domain-containing protein [Aquibium sp. A9E412]MDN2564837.1 EAL domain-containing protein [Aquibium sp. A9E412]
MTETRTIHVIDDIAEELLFVRLAVRRRRLRTVFYDTVEEFVASQALAPGDAVLVDVHIGARDAIDVLDSIAARAVPCRLLLMSGDLHGLQAARNYGATLGLRIDGMLKKPFDGATLLKALGPDGAGDAPLAADTVDVDEAVARGSLVAVMQPQLTLASGEVRSVEILSRMRANAGGPGIQQFIDALSGAQKQRLLAWNVDTALDLVARTPLDASINADIGTLTETFAAVCARLRAAPANRLTIEITEQQADSLSAASVHALHKLALAGARFSIDDFGTGQSNFQRLSRFPFQEIKIDRSLVQGCAGSRQRRVILSSIVAMAHQLDASVTAEGVENPPDLTVLQEIGCDAVQGYLVSQPLDGDGLRAFLAHWRGDA